MNKTASHSFLLSILIASAAAPVSAENWPQWRGPFFNGSTTESNLPARWSKTENVTWVLPLPGKSGATPVIWEENVFITSADAEKNLLVICVNRNTGKIRWKHVVATGDVQAGKNNMASPSVATDGKVAVALFGTGDIAAFDFNGKKLWSRNLSKETGTFSIMWRYGSSPLLYRGKLYVAVIQRNPPIYPHVVDDKPTRESFLLCIDPQTGKDHWRAVRATDAVTESQEAYTTPIPNEGVRGPEILLFGADYLTAHHPDTGAELWRCGSLNPEKIGVWRTVPSPVTGPGLVYVCLPRRKSPMYAIKDGAPGPDPKTQIAWEFPEAPDVCTPLYYRDKLFVLDGNRQFLGCLDPRTGEVKWKGTFGMKETFSASPTGADGKIYCISENGTVVVLEAGNEFKILSTIKMDEGPMMSSIAAANGQLFIRTAQNLYCIGKK